MSVAQKPFMTTSNTTTSPAWAGQCALITGGADGLGFAVARRLDILPYAAAMTAFTFDLSGGRATY